jgi:hypothetical protein
MVFNGSLKVTQIRNGLSPSRSHLMSMWSRNRRASNTFPLIAALWATLVGVYLLIASTWDRSFAILTPTPPTILEVVKTKLLDYASIVAVTGFNSASGLFIPTLLALCSLPIQKHRRAALLVTGGLTLAICLAWPFSIGLLYLPTAVLLLFAAVRTNADLAHAI